MTSHARKRDDPATIGDVLVAVDTLGRSIDRRLTGVEQGQAELRTGQAELRVGQSELRTGQSELRAGLDDVRGTVSRIEGLLTKILEGQAVLHQNDMELKRRLDERK